MEQVFVIKVRSAPPPLSQVLPSERRYSARGVLGLACVHFVLAGLIVVFIVTRAHALDNFFWPLILVCLTAINAGVCGLLAWNRWYQGVYIRGFLLAVAVSCGTAAAVALADLLTAPNFGPVVHNTLLACVFEVVWSVVSAIVAWRGVRNKAAGDEGVTLPPSVPLRYAWPGNEGAKRESEARVLEYLRGHSRPPVEGKEKGGDDISTS